MPRKSRKVRTKVEFNFSAPVVVTRPKFKVSSSLSEIDPARIARKARVVIEVGKFEGDGCGQTVTADVRKGIVRALHVTPCADVQNVRTDKSLHALMLAARRQLGLPTRPPIFKPMSFAALQEDGGGITIKTITCIQFCIWGHCIVCCSLPDGGFFCGSRIIIHTP